MNNIEDVIKKVREIRAAHKATLKGIDLMHWNLYWKLRPWIMRESSSRCVTVGEVVDKVKQYAPKTILKSREEFVKAVEELWRANHDFSIMSEPDFREDFEFYLESIFNNP